MLLTASRAQHASQIGFLAVDLSLTKTGIKILELNARAGLGVQVANQIALKNRLKKLTDLKISNPEKGVEVAKSLFGSKVLSETKNNAKNKKSIIGLYESIDIVNTKYNNLIAKIDPHAEEVILDKNIFLPDNNKFIDVKIKNKRMKLPYVVADLSSCKYNIILAGKYLQDFLIDLNTKESDAKKIIKKITKQKTDVNERILKNVDKKIYEIDRKVNILSFVKPVNLDSERIKFLDNQKTSPRFFYKEQKLDFDLIKRELKSLPKQVDHPLAKLYDKKINEIELKLNLINSINTPELQVFSEKLYGTADKLMYDKAINYLKNNPIKLDESREYNTKQIAKKLTEFLEEKNLKKWKIKISPHHTSDISVNKNNTIFLLEDAVFTENRIKAVIAHEIETHIYRLENARLQGYKLFESGTVGYLVTEEGLAIYNQKKSVECLGEKDLWPALRFIGAHLADEMGFVDLFHYLKNNYNLDDDTAWKTCVKAKRGLIDTNKKIAFTRDTVYFRGYNKVSEYLSNDTKTRLHNLYIGKVGIDDLQYLGNLEDYKVKFEITRVT